MRYDTRFRSTGYSYSSYFPVGVKWLLISNIGLFVLSVFAGRSTLGGFLAPFALSPRHVLESFAIWQLITYMFLHAGIGHILFNMLALWMFGAELERTWGTRRFLTYYFVCGVGAGICDVIANALFFSLDTRTIGSSGAVYGLLLAYGVLWPDRTILFSFLFPMKAKYFVMIIGAISFLSSVGGSSSGVSHIAHLGGMLFGYAWLRLRFPKFDPAVLRDRYNQWRLQRARRKFQVYMRKHGSDRDRRVN